MDANADSSDTDFRSFCSAAHLHDPFSHECFQRPTFKYGSKRIDYILCSFNISSLIRSVGFLPWDKPFTSEHCALFVDFREDDLFGSNALDSARPSTRRLRS